MKRMTAMLITFVLVLLMMSACDAESVATPTDLSAMEPAKVIASEDQPEASEELKERDAEETAEETGEAPTEEGKEGLLLRDAILLTLPEGEEVLSAAAGTGLTILEIKGEWCLVQVETDGETITGYIRLDDCALYGREPEEEENIRAIIISSSQRGLPVYREGMLISMGVTLIGFENDDYTIQWQYSPDNGASAYDIPGANGTSYSYYLNKTNFRYIYRVVVTYTPAENADVSQE